ncbi:MAG: class F sortase [Nocardioides sp.]
MTRRGGRLAAGALLGVLGIALPGVAEEPGPPAAEGQPLPPQWPEFEPGRLSLGATADRVIAAVDPVSVEGGTLGLPEDADRVGWWRDGSLAGAPFGTVLVAGHLDSDTDPAGYLATLAAVEPGDVVELTGEGDRQRYRVTRNYLLPRADLSARSDLFEQQRPHRLVLITCGGAYDVAAGRYEFNRIVVAQPVG